jgi:hypothetical protein
MNDVRNIGSSNTPAVTVFFQAVLDVKLTFFLNQTR